MYLILFYMMAFNHLLFLNICLFHIFKVDLAWVHKGWAYLLYNGGGFLAGSFVFTTMLALM